ncbi:MAG: SAM-dependent methyltransferase [Coxiella sp. (in: Bacteria)]|nr:MAG: SAM-dependent methyltransferase [Coxiella sp. (in: g-proteobacteria)]
MSEYRTRTDCRLCRSHNLHKVFDLAPTPPANAFVDKSALDTKQTCYPLDVYQCGDCAHVQLRTVINPDILFKNYVYVSGTSPVFVKHFDDYAQQLIAHYALSQDDLVVDIGSNDGTLLNAFKTRGLSVLGIDPATAIANKATADGIDTWPEFFNETTVRRILECKSKPKLICANNVFAHTDGLIEFVKNVKQLLADDGIFVFEVSYLVDVYENTLFDMTYHEHLAYHSVIPLQKLFHSEGLELIDTQSINTHGGSLRGIVQHQGGPHTQTPRVAEFIANEKTLKLDHVETLQRFGDNIDQIKQQLNTKLRALKAQGKKIIGYGAPAKATTLMYHFGLDASILDFIVDDSPLKQHLYTPGLHIPVLPSSAIAEHKPDYILILAWNFADSIIEKNKHLYDLGCQFITPLPIVETR